MEIHQNITNITNIKNPQETTLIERQMFLQAKLSKMFHSWDCSPITTKNTVRLREKVKADSVQTVEINSRAYLIWKFTLFLPLWGPEDYQIYVTLEIFKHPDHRKQFEHKL